MSKYHIAIIDDEQDILDIIPVILKPLDAEIFTTSKPLDLLEYLENNQVDLVIIDLVMPVITGIELLYTIKTRYEGIRCIVLSGAYEKRLIRESILLSEKYIEKPFKKDDLIKTIKETLK